MLFPILAQIDKREKVRMGKCFYFKFISRMSTLREGHFKTHTFTNTNAA